MSTSTDSQAVPDDAAGRTLPRYLSFEIRDGKWETGEMVRQHLAKELVDRGFVVDLEAGRDDPDWFFAATRGKESIGVVLVCEHMQMHPIWQEVVRPITNASSDDQTRQVRNHRFRARHSSWLCWHVSLETLGQNQLVSARLREEINLAVEQSIRKWSGVSSLRWHADHTTLGQMQPDHWHVSRMKRVHAACRTSFMLQRLREWLGWDSPAKERLSARFPNHLDLIDSREIPHEYSAGPDLSYYTESAEFYYHLIVDSAPYLKDKLPAATDADRQMAGVANNRIVNASWGLIARGAEAIPYAIKLIRSTDRDEREAAASVFCGLRDPARVTDIVAEITAALETENDRLVVDSLLVALGQLRSREAIPTIARFIMNPSEDADTRSTAVDSLGQIIKRKFDKRGADMVQDACAWLVSPGFRNP